MVVVKLPKLDVDDVEVLIAEKLPILVDLRLILNVKQTLQNVGFLELPTSQHCYLKVIL